MLDYGWNSEIKIFLMMCLLLLHDVDKIGYGTWLTKLTVLPPYQKDGYTLLREMYLKTPDDYRDNNYIIQN